MLRYPLLLLLLLIFPAVAQYPVVAIDLETKNIKGVGMDCVDREFHVAFRVPLKWGVRSQMRWKDGGEPATTTVFHDPVSDATVSLYYRLYRVPQAVPEVEGGDAQMANTRQKIAQRLREGFKDYHVRPDGCVPRVVGGRAAMSCVANYLDGKREMVEHLTWIYSRNSVGFFFSRVRAEKSDELRERMEPLIQSLEIP